MADAGTGARTEEPTPERLRKLRREGNVPRSQDVTAAVSFVVLFLLLAAMAGIAADEMRDLAHLSIHAAFSGHDRGIAVSRLLWAGLETLAITTGPILAGAVVAGVAANLAQVGLLFTTKPLEPDLNKIHPKKGLENLFSAKQLVELAKTVAKFVLVGWLSWMVVRDALRDLALLVRGDLGVGIRVVGSILWSFTTKIGGAFLLVAAVDVFYQRRRYIQDNRMSKHEVKQEYKQSEGDPRYKAERKRVHQEILQSKGAPAVKTADVVLCDSDRLAVALEYNRGKGTAPQVAAKGSRIWAEKIVEAARRHGVPVVRNAPLAHALDALEVGEEIPEELYETVAEVLHFVYSLGQEQQQKAGKR